MLLGKNVLKLCNCDLTCWIFNDDLQLLATFSSHRCNSSLQPSRLVTNLRWELALKVYGGLYGSVWCVMLWQVVEFKQHTSWKVLLYTSFRDQSTLVGYTWTTALTWCIRVECNDPSLVFADSLLYRWWSCLWSRRCSRFSVSCGEVLPRVNW